MIHIEPTQTEWMLPIVLYPRRIGNLTFEKDFGYSTKWMSKMYLQNCTRTNISTCIAMLRRFSICTLEQAWHREIVNSEWTQTNFLFHLDLQLFWCMYFGLYNVPAMCQPGKNVLLLQGNASLLWFRAATFSCSSEFFRDISAHRKGYPFTILWRCKRKAEEISAFKSPRWIPRSHYSPCLPKNERLQTNNWLSQRPETVKNPSTATLFSWIVQGFHPFVSKVTKVGFLLNLNMSKATLQTFEYLYDT